MSASIVNVVLLTGEADPGAWADLVERSPRLRRCDADIAGTPDGAAFVVAMLPRTAGDTIREIAATGRRAVVVPPVVLNACAAGRHVELADVLIGLAGGQFLARVGAWSELAIRVGGAAIGCGDDPYALMLHGLALAARAASQLEVRGVNPTAGRIELAAGSRRVTICIDAAAACTSMEVPGGARYEYCPGRETIVMGNDQRARAVAPYRERVLASLLGPGPVDSVVARVVALADAVLARAPHLVCASPAAVAAAARVTGIAASPVAPIDLGAEPAELWAFRAGIKPVVFLTVSPDQVDDTLSHFGVAHVERRERRVRIEAQDRWIDDRTSGEPRVELFIARDPAIARRAAALQADTDPSRSLRELGELMGYPPCCVEAFARQADRSNNTLNRYLAAARTAAGGPWPWQLNDLHAKLIPFYPCSYRCDAALAFAVASLAERERAYPGSTDRLRDALARTVLYIDDGHQVWSRADPIEHAEPAHGFIAQFAAL